MIQKTQLHIWTNSLKPALTATAPTTPCECWVMLDDHKLFHTRDNENARKSLAEYGVDAEMIRRFDGAFPELSGISSIKKIDFFLWAWGGNEKKENEKGK